MCIRDRAITDGVQVEPSDVSYPMPNSGWIRDGILNIDDHNVEYEVVRLSGSKATIVCPPNSPNQETIEIKRTTYLLFLTVPVHEREAPKPPDSDIITEVIAEDPDEMVFEFWRVDPNRRAVVERLSLIHISEPRDLSTSRMPSSA